MALKYLFYLSFFTQILSMDDQTLSEILAMKDQPLLEPKIEKFICDPEDPHFEDPHLIFKVKYKTILFQIPTELIPSNALRTIDEKTVLDQETTQHIIKFLDFNLINESMQELLKKSGHKIRFARKSIGMDDQTLSRILAMNDQPLLEPRIRKFICDPENPHFIVEVKYKGILFQIPTELILSKAIQKIGEKPVFDQETTRHIINFLDRNLKDKSIQEHLKKSGHKIRFAHQPKSKKI